MKKSHGTSQTPLTQPLGLRTVALEVPRELTGYLERTLTACRSSCLSRDTKIIRLGMPGLSCSLHRWTRLFCLVDACTAVQNMFCSMEEGVFLYLSVCTKISERSGLNRPAYFGRRQNPEYLCVDKVKANRFNYQCYC